MSGVFQTIDPPTPLTARRVCTPRLWCGGRTHSLGGEGGGGVHILEDADTALYSTHVSTLWVCGSLVGAPSPQQHSLQPQVTGPQEKETGSPDRIRIFGQK